ncbi:hypothetical protein EB118_05375 [bacterium]|nr:hypothetical protein [bacterium]NDC93767.1 hypothetical protein [bacterium]NDD83100.1 hypothetical protein [bacterium]NDG29515.1 hypothetical protein [bacterium]
MPGSGSGSVPSISLLKEIRDIKDVSKREILSIVLNKCIEKIVYTNRNTDKTFIIFEVPQVLIGYPLYDVSSCILFLKSELEKESYLVDFIEPFYLYIDWGGVVKHNNNKHIPKVTTKLPTMNPDKLRNQTKRLLVNFPNADEIEYVYEDAHKPQKQKPKRVPKKKI